MVNAKMFEPVLAWLDAGAPYWENSLVFDMTTTGTEHPCGTACCIAGALNQFHNLGAGGGAALVTQEVAEAVGMTRRQERNLFWATNRPEGLYEVTPAEAAAAIRSMLETGEVKW